MSNKVKRKTPFLSPDSLRATLNMLKSFYNTHTDKNKNWRDINGLQYSGIIENYGSELLLESRKLLMNNPPLKNIEINNEMDFYFNIEYSKIISNYDQQNILAATLKEDVLLSNKQYRLKFTMCMKESTLRAESSSDPNVKIDNYVTTVFDPILVITDSGTNEVEEITLALRDNTGSSTDYMFFINPSTEDLIDSFDGATLITKPITNNMNGLPFIWMCVKSLRLTPDIGFVNNIDHLANNLLTVGTDGHGDSWLYPLIYGLENTPAPDEYDGEWFIKILPVQNYQFNQNGNNGSIKIDKIIYVMLNNGELVFENTISFDHTFIDILMNDSLSWIFKRATSGDYDYDGLTYNNPVYGIIPLSTFNKNADNGPYIPAFEIRFNDNYLHEYEDACGNAVSGVHIDSSSELSANGLIKKNGVIHNLGDYDGLPNHFKYLMDKTIHRAHVELYSIRDGLNDTNQQATDKQTAAIILDTSIPPTEVEEIELNTVIKYNDLTDSYVTDGVSLSPDNFLSEITFIEGRKLGNVNIEGQSDLPKFIYNGNRTFSLYQRHDINGPERARAYYVNNDPIPYENNDRSTTPKPLRTIARICDIPTSYSQLIKVEHTSPYVIIDEKYNRTENNLSDDDLNDIWNDTSSGMVVLNTTNGVKSLFSTDDNLDELLNVDYLKEHYSTMENLNYSINLLDYEYGPDWLIEVVDGGSGYEVGDTFISVIEPGALVLKVLLLTENNGVFSLGWGIYAEYPINVSNLDGPVTMLNPVPVKTNGTGLKAQLTIREEIWNDIQRYKGEIKDNLYAYKLDENGDVWIWEYDIYKSKWFKTTRVTGEDVEYNEYDKLFNPTNRDLRSVMMYNSFNVTNIAEEIMDLWPGKTVDTDYLNIQDTFYDLSDEEHPVIYERNHIDNLTLSSFTNKDLLLPNDHEVKLFTYQNKTNRLSFMLNDNSQPSVYLYNPYEETIGIYENLFGDIKHVKTYVPITFAEVLPHECRTLNPETGVLNSDVYQYNEYEIPSDFEYKYPGKHEMKIMRRAGEQVVIKTDNGGYEPIGEQPKGTFKCISDTLYDESMFVNGNRMDSTPLMVFRIPDDIDDLSDFIITDDDGVNVSEYSLLIRGSDMFIYIEDEWIKTK